MFCKFTFLKTQKSSRGRGRAAFFSSFPVFTIEEGNFFRLVEAVKKRGDSLLTSSFRPSFSSLFPFSNCPHPITTPAAAADAVTDNPKLTKHKDS